jgi:hypothetical protein
MKWIKLFDSFFDNEYDINYVEDVCMTLSDYNLELNDVKEGSAKEMPKNKDILTNINDFDNSIIYESLVLDIKSINNFQIGGIEANFLTNKELFYDDLDDIIHHLESKFNLKLECIFFNEGFPWGFVYYRFLKDFKSSCLLRYPISRGKNIPFIRFEIMFKKLNP